MTAAVPRSRTSQFAAFLGRSLLGGLAAGAVFSGQVGALAAPHLLLALGAIGFFGAMAWPLAIAGAAAAWAVQPLRASPLWPLLVACMLAALALGAAQLAGRLVHEGTQIGLLSTVAIASGFALQSARGSGPRPAFSPEEVRASSRTAALLAGLSLLLGLAAWATISLSARSGPTVITEHSWRAYQLRQQRLDAILDVEILAYLLLLAASIWRHRRAARRRADGGGA